MKSAGKGLKFLLSAAVSLSAVAAMCPAVSAEWMETQSGYSYINDDTGEALTGWQDIDGGRYYFDKSGVALTGRYRINGDIYYFNGSKKGRMITGWAKISGNKYYFGSDGVMRTGWVTIKGSTYYFGSDGIMRTGKVRISGTVYEFNENGVLTNTVRQKQSVRIDSLMDGLKYGMTSKQVIEAMPYEDYYESDGIMMVDTGSEDYVGTYVFDVDGGLCSYGFMMLSDDADIDDAKAFFEAADWQLLSEEDGSFVYASDDYRSFGIAMDSNGVVMAQVYSYEIIEEFGSGNEDVLSYLL